MIDFEYIILSFLTGVALYGLVLLWFRMWKHIIIGYYNHFKTVSEVVE